MGPELHEVELLTSGTGNVRGVRVDGTELLVSADVGITITGGATDACFIVTIPLLVKSVNTTVVE